MNILKFWQPTTYSSGNYKGGVFRSARILKKWHVLLKQFYQRARPLIEDGDQIFVSTAPKPLCTKKGDSSSVTSFMNDYIEKNTLLKFSRSR